LNCPTGIPRPLRGVAVLLAIVAFSAGSLCAQHAPPEGVFQAGEELVYNVTYAGFNLGQIRMRLADTALPGSGPSYAARAHIDSYRSVPFVSLHTTYETIFTPAGYSVWFRSRTEHDTAWSVCTYTFAYDRKCVMIARYLTAGPVVGAADTIALDTLYQDGLSLLYAVRKFLAPGARLRFPGIVSEKKGDALVEVDAAQDHESIDAIPYPVRLLHCTGNAAFVGVYGLSGEFEGWFTDDAARIPVIAKLKVLIGSVRIELMKWKRDGWMPPEYRKEK